jgi:hypothetical protein
MGVGAAMIVHTYEKSASKVGYYIGAVIILFACLFINYAAAAFRGSNWLARLSSTGLYVHLRSYLNYKLPPQDATVVFLSFQEIHSARLVKKSVTTPDIQGRRQTQILRLVEMEFALSDEDWRTLEGRLSDEMGEQAPMEDKWYGKGSTLYRDYPVQLVSRGVMQIHWTARPRAGAFLETMKLYTTVLEMVKVSEDFEARDLKRMPAEEMEKKIRELDAKGQTIEAISLTRQVYGCGLTEAKEKVEAWRK